MRLKELMQESEVTSNEEFPEAKKKKLRNKLKDIWSVIEHFEKTGAIHKDDQPKMETFKDFIKDMVKDDERV